jgi:hypothetical protein
MLQMQPVDIADCFSPEEIQARIDSITSAIAEAENIKNYKYDDLQASQAVRAQDLDDLYSSLAVWVKAKNIQSGTESSTPSLTSLDYVKGPTI